VINFDPVDRGVFIGSCPTSAVDVWRMANTLGITAVLNLQSNVDIRRHGILWPALVEAYALSDIIVERYPIRDFDPDDLQARLAGPVDALDALLMAEHTVYVHCSAGICRAPATVIGYLHKYRGMDLAGALRLLREARPVVNPYMQAVAAAFRGTEVDQDGR
jgi:protein-tyrosine phosphatase